MFIHDTYNTYELEEDCNATNFKVNVFLYLQGRPGQVGLTILCIDLGSITVHSCTSHLMQIILLYLLNKYKVVTSIDHATLWCIAIFLHFYCNLGRDWATEDPATISYKYDLSCRLDHISLAKFLIEILCDFHKPLTYAQI